MKSLRTAAFAALASASVLFATASAQQPGDLILSSSGAKPGLYYSSFATKSISTITVEQTQAVRAFGNGIAYTTGSSPSKVQVRNGNFVFTWATLPAGAFASGIERGQDGYYLVTSFDKRVYRVGFNQLQTLKTFSTALNAIARDLDTGGYVIASASDGKVFGYDHLSKAYTTLARGRTALTAIEHMPAGYFAMGSLQANGLFLGQIGGKGLRLPIPNVNALRGEHESDTLWAVTTDGLVYKIRGSVVVDMKNYGGSYAFTGVDFVGGRKVIATKKVSSYTVRVSLAFPQSKNKQYCAALSLGTRPGIPFAGNQRINLQPDALFFLTACKSIPGLTKDFVGTTGAAGQATAEVTIPAGLPAFRFYVSAAAVNPALIGDLELANTDVVKVPASGP